MDRHFAPMLLELLAQQIRMNDRRMRFRSTRIVRLHDKGDSLRARDPSVGTRNAPPRP
jgi:hypothetical protein